MADKDILLQIERYIAGDLSVEEAEALWIKLIDTPAYVGYLETLTNLKNAKKSTDTSEPPAT